VILVDANLLIYAHDLASPFNLPARRWVESVFSGTEPVRISWTGLLAFLRITTHSRAFAKPLSMEQAFGLVDQWFTQPSVGILDPGREHRTILQKLLLETGATGPLVMDAHLAALAIEHGATLYTTDGDFGLFRGLQRVNPLTPRRDA
jgi:toxin-antitoxin system PIN domain toxin